MDEHIVILETVFQRLLESGLKINLEKSQFGSSEVTYVGFIVDKEGLRPDPNKIVDYPIPKNIRQLRRVVGMIAWYKKCLNLKVPSTPSSTNIFSVSIPCCEKTLQHHFV